jgi:hypothetical protein
VPSLEFSCLHDHVDAKSSRSKDLTKGSAAHEHEKKNIYFVGTFLCLQCCLRMVSSEGKKPESC